MIAINMRMKVLSLFTITLLTVVAFAEQNEPTSDAQLIREIPSLSKMSRSDADESATKMLTNYRVRCVALENQLLDPACTPDAKTLLCYALGELRDINASTLLAENIDFKASWRDPLTSVTRWNQYPARSALVKIGMSSIDGLLTELKLPQSENRQQMLCQTIVIVSGVDVAKLIVLKAISSEKDEQVKGRLTHCLPFIK